MVQGRAHGGMTQRWQRERRKVDWAQYPNDPNSVRQTTSNVREGHQKTCLIRPKVSSSTSQSRTPSPSAPHHETIMDDFT